MWGLGKMLLTKFSSQGLPAVRSLLKQLRPEGEKPTPRGKPNAVRDVLAELQHKLR